MTARPLIVRSRGALDAETAPWRNAGLTIGLVPTMGAVHDGHTSLVAAMKGEVDRVIATVFVNPRQFAPHEDFNAYPRGLDVDAAALTAAGADLVYAPETAAMYPPGAETEVRVPEIGARLDGWARPHFFHGVVTVVLKLLNQTRPHKAIFGEKDYQQLLCIRRMVADLDVGVEILGGPTVRAEDGLALSSRNAYLTPDERARAPELHRALQAASRALAGGAGVGEVCAAAHARLLGAGFKPVDYVKVVNTETLEDLDDVGPSLRRARILGAAWMGKARLIDNIAHPINV